MSKDIISDLKELISKYENELSSIRLKIRLLDAIPKAKALKGQCFKYRTGFSLGGRRGWGYKYIVGRSSENLLVDSFQFESSHKIEFRFNELECTSRFAYPMFIKISKKQYIKMYNKHIKYIAMLGKKRINGI